MQAQLAANTRTSFVGRGWSLSRRFFDSPTKCRAGPFWSDWVALARVLMSDVPAFALEPAKTDPAHQSDER